MQWVIHWWQILLISVQCIGYGTVYTLLCGIHVIFEYFVTKLLSSTQSELTLYTWHCNVCGHHADPYTLWDDCKIVIIIIIIIFSLSPDQDHSLADAFEYVMYGKVYRIEGDDRAGDSGKLWVKLFKNSYDMYSHSYSHCCIYYDIIVTVFIHSRGGICYTCMPSAKIQGEYKI